MVKSKILSYLCCFVCFTFVRGSGRQYESVTCLTLMEVTSVLASTSIVSCAILCDNENQESFAFNIKTSECKVFIADTHVSSTCSGGSGDVQYFKLNECQLPVPQGYSLDHPYLSSKTIARYRCTGFNDQPVFDSCPVVRCDRPLALTTTPTSCSVKDVFNRSLSVYEGGVTCTQRGVTCQRWDSKYPHLPAYFYGRSDLGNRCQLESEKLPWCYTSDPALRWDYCPVEEKGCEAPPQHLIPSTNTAVETNIMWPYHASSSFAWYRCTSLSADGPVTSCPVASCDKDLKWSQATVSCSVKDCYNITSQTYNGRVSCTDVGTPCQRWDSNFPHHIDVLTGRSDLENWCQMAGRSRPWCFTTDPNSISGYCAVEPCS